MKPALEQPQAKIPTRRPANHRDTQRSAVSGRLLTQAAATSDTAVRRRLQNEVVEVHLGLARAIALRYRGRGINEDDLIQAASMALIKAARGFDVNRGSEFLSYATVTITGEVKRQFRDHGWMVRPPRTIQKLQMDVRRVQGELTHNLCRSPRISEVAQYLEVPIENVIEAVSSDGCFTPTSLDTPVGEQGSACLGDLLRAEDDPAMRSAEARVMLAPAVRALPEYEQRVLFLRFFKQRTQTEIAVELGTTQMKVSRTLSRVLTQLRGKLQE
jgi:RNA polymerase sigma-B factor